MRFAIILAAASAAIVAAQDFEQCSDMPALSSCTTPLNSAQADCGVDYDCLCKNLTDRLDCFEKYCPEVEFPTQDVGSWVSQCGAVSDSGDDDDDDDDDEPEANDDTSGGSDDQQSGGGEGAGASLFAPASGLLAAIVAVAAML